MTNLAGNGVRNAAGIRPDPGISSDNLSLEAVTNALLLRPGLGEHEGRYSLVLLRTLRREAT